MHNTRVLILAHINGMQPAFMFFIPPVLSCCDKSKYSGSMICQMFSHNSANGMFEIVLV